jgi:DNA-binding NtrC family response regulator
MAKILLLGLEPSLAHDLTGVLRQLGHSIAGQQETGAAAETTDADLVFAGSEDYRDALFLFPRRPVIVTSRLPEMKAWLSALEAGATDYCGAPFEPTQVRWVLNSALAA